MAELNQGRKQEEQLKALVGECLHSWSLVELSLSHLFVEHLNAKRPLGYVVWDTIISFDAKFKSLNAILCHNIEDEELRLIWAKLVDRVSKGARQRNELAHSGYMGNSHETSLVPYLSMYQFINDPKNIKRLNVNNLKHRNTLFLAMNKALQWFATCSLSAPDTKDVLSAPDLIKELRKLIAQSREESLHLDQSCDP